MNRERNFLFFLFSSKTFAYIGSIVICFTDDEVKQTRDTDCVANKENDAGCFFYSVNPLRKLIKMMRDKRQQQKKGRELNLKKREKFQH